MTAAFVLAGSLSATSFGQAMGTAALDPTPVIETPVVAAPATLPAASRATAIPVFTPPEPSALDKMPGVDHAVPATDAASSSNDKPTDSVTRIAASEPAATAPADQTATLRAIEGQTIKPRSSEPVVGPTKTATPTATMPSGISNALQVATALTVVVGLIFIGKALARKFLPGAKAGNGKGVIEILARHPLCKNQSIVLIRIGSQIIALNQAKDQSQSVLVISDQMEVAKILGQIEGQSDSSSQAGFTKLLANARMDLSDETNDPARDENMAENLDEQLEEMAAAKRQLMELRHQVRSVRDRMPS